MSRSHRNTQAAACSPLGKKEAAANKAAMATFSVWMNREAQAWADVLIAALAKDLQPPATR